MKCFYVSMLLENLRRMFKFTPKNVTTRKESKMANLVIQNNDDNDSDEEDDKLRKITK